MPYTLVDVLATVVLGAITLILLFYMLQTLPRILGKIFFPEGQHPPSKEMSDYEKQRYMEKIMADDRFDKESEKAKAEDGKVNYYFNYR